jgi:hypothetical protein
VQPRRTKSRELVTRHYAAGQLPGLLRQQRPAGAVLATETVARLAVASMDETRSSPLSARVAKTETAARRRLGTRASALALVASGVVLATIGRAALDLRARPSSRLRAHESAARVSQTAQVSATAGQRAPSAAPTSAAPTRPAIASNASPAAERDARPESPPETPSTNAAVAQLANGHYREALTAYRALMRARPEQPAYAAVAAILERKLSSRCTRRLESGELPCPAPPH